MKLVIERAVLLKALSPIQSVVERRGTIPILANVRLDADKGALSLTATDMDIAIVEKVAAVGAAPDAGLALNEQPGGHDKAGGVAKIVAVGMGDFVDLFLI